MNVSIPIFVMMILVFGFIFQPSVFASNDKKESKEFKIPPGLSEIAPGVYSLGKAKDIDGTEVEGVMFIHGKNEFAKNVGAVGKPAQNCYSFLTKKGVKWTAAEPWEVNTANLSGLSSSFVFNNISSNIAKWEDASDGVIGNGQGQNIMGNGGSVNTPLTADSSAPDGSNEIYFADISTNGVIAVTTTWYSTLSGQIVEWDQVYDDVSFDWSDSSVNGVAGEMDFENISTHEIGHAVGLGHPSDSCTEETMYKYASYGETKKRDLNTGDINGINALY